jgi:hypothetical protein
VQYFTFAQFYVLNNLVKYRLASSHHSSRSLIGINCIAANSLQNAENWYSFWAFWNDKVANRGDGHIIGGVRQVEKWKKPVVEIAWLMLASLNTGGVVRITIRNPTRSLGLLLRHHIVSPMLGEIGTKSSNWGWRASRHRVPRNVACQAVPRETRELATNTGRI